MSRTKQTTSDSNIPCIKVFKIPNDYPLKVIKLNNTIFLLQTTSNCTLMTIEGLKQIKVIKESENSKLRSFQVVLKKFLIAYAKTSILFFRIDEYDLEFLLRIENPNRKFLKILELKFLRDKIGICWQNEGNQGRIDIYDLSPQKIQLKQSYIIENKNIGLQSLRSLVEFYRSNYYIYSKKFNQQCIIKMKFKNRLIIKEVKTFNFSHGNLNCNLNQGIACAKDQQQGNQRFTSFFDPKKQKVTNFQSSLGDNQNFVYHFITLPCYNKKSYPYFLGRIEIYSNRFSLLNYANSEVIYHLLNFPSKILLFKATVPMIDCQYANKPKLKTIAIVYNTRQHSKKVKEEEEKKGQEEETKGQEEEKKGQEEEKKCKDSVMQEAKQELMPKIFHECNFTYGNYDVISFLKHPQVEKYRFMIPGLENDPLI